MMSDDSLLFALTTDKSNDSIASCRDAWPEPDTRPKPTQWQEESSKGDRRTSI